MPDEESEEPIVIRGSGYAANSHKSKNEAKVPAKPEIKSVITGVAQKRKPSIGRRFKETFIGEDARSVAATLVADVIVPAIKSTISDAISQGIERMLFGDVRGRMSRGNVTNITSRSGGYTNYQRSYPGKPTPTEDRRPLSTNARANHDFSEIFLASRADAEMALDALVQLVDQYGQASVSDFLSLVNETGDYTDNKYGWTNLRDAGILRTRQGFLIDLPRPEVLIT